MIFTTMDISGAFLIDQEPHHDSRGYFARAYCQQEFTRAGISFIPIQSNYSYTEKKGTLRGLHYQLPPHSEDKFIRVTRGALWYVILDLRPSSPTYGIWKGIEINSKSCRQIFMPSGCAAGFQTLTDDVELVYFVSSFYSSSDSRGIRWNDPAFDIQWPLQTPTCISEQDNTWPDYSLCIQK